MPPTNSIKSDTTDMESIFVDNSNLTELKLTCDEAVERILTRASHSLSTASNHSSVDAKRSTSAKPSVQDEFPPFKASHFHTDLRLVLGFTASAVMIGATLWAYFVEKEWQKNKKPCAIAVIIYVALSVIQTIDSYWQGHTIFIGKRKMLSKRIETEKLKIASPPLPPPEKTDKLGPNGKTILTPPVYILNVDFTRNSNKGKSLLGRKKDSVTLGHMGEWFTQDGEFVESVFQERLLSSLQKVFGQ